MGDGSRRAMLALGSGICFALMALVLKAGCQRDRRGEFIWQNEQQDQGRFRPLTQTDWTARSSPIMIVANSLSQTELAFALRCSIAGVEARSSTVISASSPGVRLPILSCK